MIWILVRESAYENRFHQHNDRYTITGSPRYWYLFIRYIIVMSSGSPLRPYGRYRGILGCSWLLVFVLNNTLILCIWCSAQNNLLPPMMFLPLDLPSEYRIQHGAIGPLYVTFSYSTWIFCRGVSGFATDRPCGVWCRGLTTCLLHVGPPFGNRLLKTVGL